MNGEAFEQAAGLYNYWIVIVLMMTGFYIVLARRNLIKSVIGLNIFQTSVFLLYVTMGKVRGGTAPIIPPEVAAAQAKAMHADEHSTHTLGTVSHDIVGGHAEHAALPGADIIYSNPLPSVLMLTAIVVGIATTALALALVVRIREDYGTIEEDRILEIDRADAEPDEEDESAWLDETAQTVVISSPPSSDTESVN
ncbi:cation:proton antiporter subunit C [Rhodopirellula sp. JC740]|uniref:Cation:proton antiporter subunit C n=1 Tax=Rhodopirellula halodulae TaxID=2894198 RepID=A0ABS8NF43_9BACT|nr:cation:proton antiporter subunit C [Rhodopirellula sp. JC740]MCC9642175.1 cation:proton antiporter subunit C [Rhodopirellula sp. JC740]